MNPIDAYSIGSFPHRISLRLLDIGDPACLRCKAMQFFDMLLNLFIGSHEEKDDFDYLLALTLI